VRGALEAESEDHISLRIDAFPANLHIIRVEPRGFEPLTSAVQRRTTISYLCPAASKYLACLHGFISLRVITFPTAYRYVLSRLHYGLQYFFAFRKQDGLSRTRHLPDVALLILSRLRSDGA
jgi:hypothetical protein